MLDALLGREALKERINTLEEELERVNRRLEAETERRQAAVRDRQTADQRVNTLEDKIAELEGRLAQEESGGAEHEWFRSYPVGYERMADLLEVLSSVRTASEGAMTAYLATDTLGDESTVAELIGPVIHRSRPCLAIADDAGLVRGCFAPPVAPDPFLTWDDRFQIHPEWFVPCGRFSMALVRSDLFALGRYRDDELLEQTGFTSDVKEAHSKGGFSQARFERRRSSQIDEHLDRCHAVIDSADPERLIVVGERTVLSSFRSRADVTGTVDATGAPEDALEDAFRSFWRTQVMIP